MTRVVGVAGKCCAGKDLVTRWLLNRGWREINVDQVGHRALVVLRDQVVETFGEGILSLDRSGIDRKRLGEVVFSDPAELRKLEAIVHPWMRREVESSVRRLSTGPKAVPGATGGQSSRADLSSNGDQSPSGNQPPSGDQSPNRHQDHDAEAPRGLVINAALLFHMHLDTLCDAIILVRAPLWHRVLRARRRDGAPWGSILRRVWSQRRLHAQARRSPADIIIVDNRETPEVLYRHLEHDVRLQ